MNSYVKTLLIHSLFLCHGHCRYANAILVAPGETYHGSGVVSEDLVNQGSVIGDGPDVSDRLVFDADSTVSYFENMFVLGTFAPGNSPAISSGENQGFGGTIEIELGGTTPGSGPNNMTRLSMQAKCCCSTGPTWR